MKAGFVNNHQDKKKRLRWHLQGVSSGWAIFQAYSLGQHFTYIHSCSITLWLLCRRGGRSQKEGTHGLRWKWMQWNSQTNSSASLKCLKWYLPREGRAVTPNRQAVLKSRRKRRCPSWRVWQKNFLSKLHPLYSTHDADGLRYTWSQLSSAALADSELLMACSPWSSVPATPAQGLWRAELEALHHVYVFLTKQKWRRSSKHLPVSKS